MVHLCGEQQIARREALARAQQHLALAEIPAGRADEVFAAEIVNEDIRPVSACVLLDDDQIGATRHRRAGEDTHGFPAFDRLLEWMAGSRRTDQGEMRRQALHVGAAHRIAVHGRSREGGLRERCREISGEHAAGALANGHVLSGERLKVGGDARQSFGNGNHGPNA